MLVNIGRPALRGEKSPARKRLPVSMVRLTHPWVDFGLQSGAGEGGAGVSSRLRHTCHLHVPEREGERDPCILCHVDAGYLELKLVGTGGALGTPTP